MSRGITYSDVANAIAQLTAKGAHPTMEAVRGQLGTGSLTTIAKHLKTWREGDSAKGHLETREVPTTLASHLKGLWEVVLCEADEKINSAQKKFDTTLSAYSTDIDGLKNEIRTLQQKLKIALEEIASLNQNKIGLESLLSQKQNENSALHAKLETIHSTLSEKQSRIEELQRLYQQAQENLEHYRESSREQRVIEQQRHEEERQQLTLDMQNLNNENSYLKTENNNVKQELASVTLEIESLSEQLLQQSDKLHMAETAHIETSKQLKAQIDLAMRLQGSRDELCSSNDKMHQDILELEKRNTMLDNQLQNNIQNLKDVTTQNKLLAQEKWEIGQKYAELLGKLKQIEEMA